MYAFQWYEFIPIFILFYVCFHTYNKNVILHPILKHASDVPKDGNAHPELEQYITSFTKKEKNDLKLFLQSIKVYAKYDTDFHKLWNMTIKFMVGDKKITESQYAKYTFGKLFSDSEMCRMDSISYFNNVDVERIHNIITKVYQNTFSIFNVYKKKTTKEELSILYKYSQGNELNDDTALRISEFMKDMYLYYNTIINDNGIMGFRYDDYKSKYAVPQQYITSVLRLNSDWLSHTHFEEEELAYHVLYMMIQFAATNGVKASLSEYTHDKEDVALIIKMYMTEIYTHR